MHRLLTGLFLAAILTGGMTGGCQPTKPCRCVQSRGCRCPLPPPPARPAKPAAPIQPPQPAGERQRTHQAAESQTEAAHRGERESSTREWHGADHERRARKRHETPASSRSGGALSSDDVNFSRGYREDQTRFFETRGMLHNPPGARETFEHWERHHHGPYRQGRGYIFGHHKEDAEQSPPGTSDYERDPEGASRMSINTPAARDPWHGYGVACPGREGR